MLMCSACRSVSYCCKSHQRSDWKTHKPYCCLMRARQAGATPSSILDGGHKHDEYVGTLIWSPGLKFAKLPPFPMHRWPPPLGGEDWRGYMQWRFHDVESKDVIVDASTLDALSFPVTLALVFYKLKLVVSFRGMGEVRVVLAGASSRTEERLLLETDYWAESGHLLPDMPLCLCFVGPEVSKASHGRTFQVSDSVRAVCHRGDLVDFLKNSEDTKRRSVADQPTVIIGFNPGFGNTNAKLTREWMASLLEIAESRLVAAFTCANDYADLRGELAIWSRALGSRFVLEPERNAFRAVTVAHAPGERDSTWYCANCFLYAVQGYKGDVHALSKDEPPPKHTLSEVEKRLEQILEETKDGGQSSSLAVCSTRVSTEHVLSSSAEDSAKRLHVLTADATKSKVRVNQNPHARSHAASVTEVGPPDVTCSRADKHIRSDRKSAPAPSGFVNGFSLEARTNSSTKSYLNVDANSLPGHEPENTALLSWEPSEGSRVLFQSSHRVGGPCMDLDDLD